MINEKEYIQFEKLNLFDEVGHLYTKNPFNFNANIINTDKINDQYDDIKKILNCNSLIIKKPSQIHSNCVKVVTKHNINEIFDECDGLITDLKNVALVTSLADCQGILIYDNNKKVIGNIHSGWKGTLNEIIINAIDLMIKTYKCNKDNIYVYFCPSILKCCFEVDEDVMLLFKTKFYYMNNIISAKVEKNGVSKYYIDTIEINKLLLLKIGIKQENIVFSNICTKCNSSQFHSHRSEGVNSGRNIALIYLK